MTSSTTTHKRKFSYDELKIEGPPLFKQGCLPDNFKSPRKSLPGGNDNASFSTEVLRSSHCPPLSPSKTALLIVDVQPEYWSECPPVRRDFEHFPDRISSLINNCRSQSMKRIIWVRADYSYEHSPWLHQFARLHEGSIPPIVRPSSKWEDFAQPLENEMIITKTSWSSTSGGTGLLSTLKNDGIDTVLVCGLITSVCVQHSAFGVFEAGYRTILVTDACADRGRERHEAALALYGDYMYELRSVQSLKVELDEQHCICEKKRKIVPMIVKEVELDKKNVIEICGRVISSIVAEGVSILLPPIVEGVLEHNGFGDSGGDAGHRDEQQKMTMMTTMIKSKSIDSLNSATTFDESVLSSIDEASATIKT